MNWTMPELPQNGSIPNIMNTMLPPKDVLDLIEQLPQIYDEPFGNASVIPAFYCAKFAGEEGIDILLGGDGGDEIFGRQ